MDAGPLQMGYQNDSHATIVDILAYFAPFDSLGRKAKAVRLDVSSTDIAEHVFEPLDTAVSKAKQVQITCSAVRTPAPERE